MSGSNVLAGRTSVRSEARLPVASAIAECMRTAKLALGRILTRTFKETPQRSHGTRDFWSRVTASDQCHSMIVVALTSLLLLSLYFTSKSIILHRQDMDCETGYLGGSARSLRLGEGFNSSDDLRGCILMIDSRFRISGPSTILEEVSKQLRYVEEFHQQSSIQRDKLEALVREASYYHAARTINWYD